ncbi:hypothetical protein [Nocardioides sp. Soil805]|uniref:hypothetical protein n=1 Tax=Nocardioides sp. Soil805 TaxID=1736416 RepID=UPI000703230E|nr:hypothetical protein [Nocardioides sp. Soil805]KRF34828.1 hypothetical protein ASG94_11735 [Nocardioides sp. Soil805]
MIWLVLGVVVAWLALGPWVPVAVLVALCVPRVRWWVLDRLWITRRGLAIAAAVVAAVAGIIVVVPDGWLPVPPSPGVLVAPSYVGRPAQARPLQVGTVPQNPHLARNGAGAVLDDAWSTGATPWSGPVGLQPEVDSAWYGLEHCTTLTLDGRDRLVGLCGDRGGSALHVIDPDSLHPLATKRLPSPKDDGCAAGLDAAYLDAGDRMVVATSDRRVLAVSTADADGEPDLTTDRTWDLSTQVPADDCVVALLPDWQGRIWWATRGGLVGTVAPDSGEVRVLDLGEEVAHPFSTDETGGTYVLTTHALYRLSVDEAGTPVVGWRTAYDRGADRKSGQATRGSGTSPVLLDGGVIAFADNAEPRLHVVMVERSNGAEICRAAVFDDEASATDSALASVGGGVVVANTHGYAGPLRTLLGRGTTGGLARVDVPADRSAGECRVRWTSELVAPSGAPQVSVGTGLVYVSTKRPTWWGVSAWYLTGVDVRSGRAMFGVRTGTGVLANNDHATLTLAPDGTAYVATLGGMVRVQDRRPQEAVESQGE